MIKTLIIRLFAVIYCVAAFGSRYCWADAREKVGERDILFNNGIIFSRASTLASGEGLCHELRFCWTPSITDTRQLDQDLLRYFKQSKEYDSAKIARNFQSYKRKYWGFYRSGVRLVQVNGLCPLYWGKNHKMNTSARPVYDMGVCYFVVTYNVRTRQFTDLYIDGEA